MAPLNLKTIEQRVNSLAQQEHFTEDILFDLLLAYGRSKSNNTRLRNGSLNVAEDPTTDYALKGVVYFHPILADGSPAQDHHHSSNEREAPDTAASGVRTPTTGTDIQAEPPDIDSQADTPTTQADRETQLLAAVERLRTHERAVRYKTRFVIATDYQWMAAVDTITGENRIFPLKDLGKHYAFFLPWAGMEKAQYVPERPADTKAAERMGELFDALVHANSVRLETDADRHGLNIFFTRLLFCYFAEDTGLFEDGAFTTAITSRTREDGSDTAEAITEIFDALDVADKSDYPEHLKHFPYVNGRLFSADAAYQVPQFDRKSRELLIQLGRLIWQDINPDIFGSMFQAVVQNGKRSELGQHYTSVPNILKTIEPLFLDELKEQFDAAYDSAPRLEKLLKRIGGIKIFDPACGSGNFLVIAYKELRWLEHAILERLSHLSEKHFTLFSDSVVKIDHFYGIEIDDFATEVAVLALWIAKHQMNREYKDKFGADLPMIPLRSMGQITCANACRVDWEEVCPHTPDEEVYLIGNPPYKGGKSQDKEMKADYPYVFGDEKYSKDLDYIALWFIKGARYIAHSKAELAFVSTNSITQGDHVAIFFPHIYREDVEIGFAYTSFKWTNNAKYNAGVTVIVLSLRAKSTATKYLFTGDKIITSSRINAYLSDADDIIVSKREKSISGLPHMSLGSMPKDGGNLNLDRLEFEELTQARPEAQKYLKKYMGAAEFIRGIDRYCLWITDEEVDEARTIPPIDARLNAVSAFREASKAGSTREYAAYPHRFRQRAYKPTDSIIVPKVSSERRAYVPIGFLDKDTVISDLAFAVYDAEPWLFALLTSKMHMAWLRAVGGKMETRYRYGNKIVYNTFPVPDLSDNAKAELTRTALRILDVREYFCECTLAELYDPDTMPELLREAHADNDRAVDKIYRKRGFETDEERLAELFRLYEAMTAEEASKAPSKKAGKPARRKKSSTSTATD